MLKTIFSFFTILQPEQGSAEWFFILDYLLGLVSLMLQLGWLEELEGSLHVASPQDLLGFSSAQWPQGSRIS